MEKILKLKRLLVVAVVIFCFTLLNQKIAFAHLHDYLVTYPYWTAAKTEVELELWNDYNFETKSLKHQTELEYGITDKWTLGIYGVFVKKQNESFKYDALKIEQRYRLADPDKFFVNPALYFEYKKPADSSKDEEIEAKIILSKDLKKLNFTTNLIAEKELNSKANWEYFYTLAAMYPYYFKNISLGIEFKGGFEGNKNYLIPGFYIDLPDRKRLNIGLQFGLSKSDNSTTLRSLYEIEF